MLRNDEIEVLNGVYEALTDDELKEKLGTLIERVKSERAKKNIRDARYKREHRAIDPNYCR